MPPLLKFARQHQGSSPLYDFGLLRVEIVVAWPCWFDICAKTYIHLFPSPYNDKKPLLEGLCLCALQYIA